MSDVTSETKKTKSTTPVVVIAILVMIVCAFFQCGGRGGDSSSSSSSSSEMTTMYVCGYDRCKESGEYGTLIYSSGINAWSHPTERTEVIAKLNHGEKVIVIDKTRGFSGPGGLLYELHSTDGGGWISDLWLTSEKCTADNLYRMSFTDCISGEY